MVTTGRMGLDTILAIEPQLPKAQRWPVLVRYIFKKILAAKPKTRLNHADTVKLLAADHLGNWVTDEIRIIVSLI